MAGLSNFIGRQDKINYGRQFRILNRLV